jgi:hypothetical protein
LAILLAFVLASCEAETRNVASPTQITLSIDTSSASIRKSLDAVRITVSRPAGSGKDALKNGVWTSVTTLTIPRRDIFEWPLDIPVIPVNGVDDGAYFEVVVDALQGEEVLAQTRGITRFDVRAWRRFPLLIAACTDKAICESDAECHGIGCSLCDPARGCVQVTVTDPRSLANPDEDAASDAGPRDSGPGSSGDGGSPRKDGSALPPASPDAGASQGGFGECDTVDAFRCVSGQPSAREQCQDGMWMHAAPCEQGKSCVTDQDGAVGCAGPCDGTTCDDHATCDVVAGAPLCQCTPPYVGDGKTCSFDDTCAALGCDPSAECAMVSSERQCRCRSGYTGDGKSCKNIDECAASASPCDASATCTDTPGSFTCACKPGFTGDGTKCSNADECGTNPCQHGGTCSDGVNAYTCNCAGTGYSGDRCEKNVDDCSPNPCQHGAKCTDAVSDFMCSCGGTGFTGKRCDSNVDDCASNPCTHGGRCSDGVMMSSCDCTGTGFTGARCETNVNDCSPNPCMHSGRCTDGVNDFTCSCPAGYRGERCEVDINDCATNPCQHGGTCTDGVNKYTCECAVGWSGTNCQTSSCGNGTVDRGEACDPASSPDAKWKCDTTCRTARLYTFCNSNADCPTTTTFCTQNRLCQSVGCRTNSDCLPVLGKQIECYTGGCSVPCNTYMDCAPGAFCVEVEPGKKLCYGASGTVEGGSCTDNPFGCPQGATCDSEGTCIGHPG